MSLLLGKKFLILGLLNKYSIAYGIAKSFYSQGAILAFTYQKKKSKKKILKIIKEFNSTILIKCNFIYVNELKNVLVKLKKYWKNINGIIHSVAYLKKNFLNTKYINGIYKKYFQETHLVTSYSFSMLAKIFKNFFSKNSTMLTISYLGSSKVITNYNFMGLSKASLESSVRYLASSLGPNIRVNAISSGPIKTSSTYTMKNFKRILSIYKKRSPMKRNTTIYEIGDVAVFLSSYLSRGITGQIIYVDGGFNIIGI